jgi:hypothetical protein
LVRAARSASASRARISGSMARTPNRSLSNGGSGPRVLPFRAANEPIDRARFAVPPARSKSEGGPTPHHRRIQKNCLGRECAHLLSRRRESCPDRASALPCADLGAVAASRRARRRERTLMRASRANPVSWVIAADHRAERKAGLGVDAGGVRPEQAALTRSPPSFSVRQMRWLALTRPGGVCSHAGVKVSILRSGVARRRGRA